MDKTDMMFGPRDYLRRASLAADASADTTKAREGVRKMNAGFAKLAKPRDTKWTSRGGGMVYDGKQNTRRYTWKRVEARPLDGADDMAPVMFVSHGHIRKPSSARW